MRSQLKQQRKTRAVSRRAPPLIYSMIMCDLHNVSEVHFPPLKREKVIYVSQYGAKYMISYSYNQWHCLYQYNFWKSWGAGAGVRTSGPDVHGTDHAAVHPKYPAKPWSHLRKMQWASNHSKHASLLEKRTFLRQDGSLPSNCVEVRYQSSFGSGGWKDF